MMRFDFTISHVPGKDLEIADALSRAPSSQPTLEDQLLQQDTRAFVNVIFQSLPTTELERRLEDIKESQHNDQICREIARYCKNGSPNRDKLTGTVKKFLPVASEITIVKGLLMRGN